MGGYIADEKRIADTWVGQRVEAVILRPWGMTDPQWGTPTSRSLTAWQDVGVIERVDDLGILASFEDKGEPEPTTFYPWGAVLSFRPAR
jgi:hypothetical protein